MESKKQARSNRRGPAAAGKDEKGVVARKAAVELAEEDAASVRRAAEQHGLHLHEATAAVAKAGEELTARAQDGATTLAQSGGEVAAGLQDVGRVWAEFVQDGMRESMAAAQSLLRARSFGEAMRIQGEYLRNSFELLLDTSAEISELSKQMVSITAHGMATIAVEAPTARS
jgi:phasin family protein